MRRHEGQAPAQVLTLEYNSIRRVPALRGACKKLALPRSLHASRIYAVTHSPPRLSGRGETLISEFYLVNQPLLHYATRIITAVNIPQFIDRPSITRRSGKLLILLSFTQKNPFQYDFENQVMNNKNLGELFRCVDSFRTCEVGTRVSSASFDYMHQGEKSHHISILLLEVRLKPPQVS